MQFSRVEPRSQLALSFLFICCSIKPALAHDHFNPLSLENDEPGVENVDLSVFEKGGQAENIWLKSFHSLLTYWRLFKKRE
ncbi:hypothetical protein, partial [Salmonella enterica]|uniref:hypothetical protein n=1 Tax=Salmonella enterica TaxID=28901 RepID=UPI0037045029